MVVLPATSGFMPRMFRFCVLAALPTLMLSACNEQQESKEPQVRPVRTVTVEKRETGIPLVLTGRIESADEASLGFRIAGRMFERTVGVGDRVQPGQIIARLEPQNEMNALRSAQASLAAAQAQLVEASNRYERQAKLLSQGWTTRANYDQAEKSRQTARAQVDAAEAQLESAHDLVGFTELKADAPGVVTAVGAEPHEVVQAGQMIVRLARHDGRDAVFDVPAQALRTAESGSEILVHLTDDPKVTANGRVREVAPQADPTTRTFQVKVGLTDPPEAMRLGGTVTGTLKSSADPVIEIPASSMTRTSDRPAVWVVDQSTDTVSLRNVEVARFDPATVAIAEGLDSGEVIVTAGVQALHPGQKIRILGAR